MKNPRGENMPRWPGLSHMQAAKPRMAAALVLLATVSLSATLSGCGVSIVASEPSTKVSQSAGAGASSSSTSTSPSAIPSSGMQPTGSPAPQATAAPWKTYVDPGKSVSFELPADWTTALVPGTSGSLQVVEVRDAAGTKVATLTTGGGGLGGACGPDTQRPYTVLASVPLGIPTFSKDPAAVDPRFVYRLIQGANSFFASYGIADHPAGADGMACLVYNTVTTAKLGLLSFGDVVQLRSDPEGTPGTRAFATIADAQAYMQTAEYQNIQRMITSVKLLS